jgi:aquaporin-1
MANQLNNTRLSINFRVMMAEFLAMTLFVYIGCATAVLYSAPRDFDYKMSPFSTIHSFSFSVTIPLTFGLAIAALVYAIGPMGAGQINSTLTWALTLAGRMSWWQCLANTIAQFSGSILGASLLLGTLPNPFQTSLGSNAVANGVSVGNAFMGETIMTMVLALVVLWCTSVETSKVGHPAFAPLAIGFTVFLGHTVLLPLDGCSINPSRSFGPALISMKWDNFWVFVVGPYLGASLAVGLYYVMEWMRFQESDGPVLSAEKREINTSQDTLHDYPLTEVQEHVPREVYNNN